MIPRSNRFEKLVNAARSTLCDIRHLSKFKSSFRLFIYCNLHFSVMNMQFNQKKNNCSFGRFVCNSDKITQNDEKCTIALLANVDTIILGIPKKLISLKKHRSEKKYLDKPTNYSLTEK